MINFTAYMSYLQIAELGTSGTIISRKVFLFSEGDVDVDNEEDILNDNLF